MVDALEQVPSVQAVVLGGSYARGMARAYSDIDLGVFYSDESALPIPGVRDVTTQILGSVNPLVSEVVEWGPWVNGGAWLTLQGQRVDLIYRSLENLERVISDVERGQYELHYG